MCLSFNIEEDQVLHLYTRNHLYVVLLDSIRGLIFGWNKSGLGQGCFLS